jgi:hypothetical protein
VLVASVPVSKGIMHAPLSRAERYQKVAAQYLDVAKTAPPPFLRSSYCERTGKADKSMYARKSSTSVA